MREPRGNCPFAPDHQTEISRHLDPLHDLDLGDFANLTRLFPLGGVVLFPHVVLPLHIFEPRYRQMTENALAGDRLITIIQSMGSRPGEPGVVPLAPVGCLGRIIKHERLADGRFNLLLLGLRRVRIVQELAVATLYRQAQVEVLEDEPEGSEARPHARELADLFLKLTDRDAEWESILNRGLSLGTLTDLIAHAIPVGPDIKQSLLEQTSAIARAVTLSKLLKAIEAAHPSGTGQRRRSSPPPFSLN